MNVVTLVGRMARDPELRYTTSTGTAMCTFTIAVDRQYSNKEGQKVTDFFNVVSWGRQAENIVNYTAKGSLVAIKGSIENNPYETQTGEKRYSTKVNAEYVQFLSKAPPVDSSPYQADKYKYGNRDEGAEIGSQIKGSEDSRKVERSKPSGVKDEDYSYYKELYEDDVPF